MIFGNCCFAGYAATEKMVMKSCEYEEYHLDAMVTFFKNAGLEDELRRHDCRGFARGCNGAGYAKHGYHIKPAKAFAKGRATPDTQFVIDRRGADIVGNSSCFCLRIERRSG